MKVRPVLIAAAMVTEVAPAGIVAARQVMRARLRLMRTLPFLKVRLEMMRIFPASLTVMSQAPIKKAARLIPGRVIR